MKYLLALSLLLVGFSSCKKHGTSSSGGQDCGVQDPIINLPWLHAKTLGTGHCSIYQQSYHSTTGFMYSTGNVTTSWQTSSRTFYSCTGTTLYLAEYGGIVGAISTFPADFDQQSTDVKLIYER